MQDGQQPGWVFTPGGPAPDQADDPASQSSLEPEPVILPPAQPDPGPTMQQPTVSPQMVHSGTGISWTASEYLANPKNSSWFLLLGLATIVLAAIVYLVTRDVLPTVVIFILAIIVGIFAARQPKVLDYKLDSNGLNVGSRFYPYTQFKSFSVAQDHAMAYISLMPLKRFMPPLVVHFEPQDEDLIADTLADYLPYEDHKTDVIDRITKRTRF